VLIARHENAPVFIQSFEVANLKALSRMTALPRVQLIEAEANVLCGDPRRLLGYPSP